MKNLLVTLFACATLSYANAAENKTIRKLMMNFVR